MFFSCFLSLGFFLVFAEETVNKAFILVTTGKLVVDIKYVPFDRYFFFGERIESLFIHDVVVESYAAFLPQRNVVVVDAILVEQFVFIRDANSFKHRGGPATALVVFP